MFTKVVNVEMKLQEISFTSRVLTLDFVFLLKNSTQITNIIYDVGYVWQKVADSR